MAKQSRLVARQAQALEGNVALLAAMIEKLDRIEAKLDALMAPPAWTAVSNGIELWNETEMLGTLTAEIETDEPETPVEQTEAETQAKAETEPTIEAQAKPKTKGGTAK